MSVIIKSSLAIVIPVYNEADTIQKTLLSIKKNITIQHIVYIIYDHDDDTTIPIIKNLSYNNVILIKNIYGKGALNAIKTGFHQSTALGTLVVMADLSDDLSDVSLMFKKLENGYDIICGSRYMPGGKQKGGPFIKSFLSRVAGCSLYYLTTIPTHDITNSFKLYRTSLLKNILIESSGGFELGMEITIKAFLQEAKITEIPTIWHDRTKGASRFRLLSWMPHYLKWYLLLLKKKNYFKLFLCTFFIKCRQFLFVVVPKE